jgi:hypothetical protein
MIMIPMLLVVVTMYVGGFAETTNIRIRRRRRFVWVLPISLPMRVGIHLEVSIISVLRWQCRCRPIISLFGWQYR